VRGNWRVVISRTSRWRVLEGLALRPHHQVARLANVTRHLLRDAAQQIATAVTLQQLVICKAKMLVIWSRSKKRNIAIVKAISINRLRVVFERRFLAIDRERISELSVPAWRRSL